MTLLFVSELREYANGVILAHTPQQLAARTQHSPCTRVCKAQASTQERLSAAPCSHARTQAHTL